MELVIYANAGNGVCEYELIHIISLDGPANGAN